MELFFFCDALRRSEARKVIGVIPYFGYARQDIQHRSGECVSANVVIRFLESIGFNKIFTVNLHDEATEGVFSIPFKNINAFPLLANEIRNYLGADQTKTENVAVSRRTTGSGAREKFSDVLFGNEKHTISVVEKRRDLEHIHQSLALDLYGTLRTRPPFSLTTFSRPAGPSSMRQTSAWSGVRPALSPQSSIMILPPMRRA
jgi:ribose-phosphate pyrophosphokinase